MGPRVEAARGGARPQQRGNGVLRRTGGERVGQRGDEVRAAPSHGPRVGGDGQEDAQARLDAAGDRAGGPAADSPSTPSYVRLPTRSFGGRNPARAQV